MASKVNVDKIARGSGTPEFTIPTADGTSGQFIKTDASGVLSFGSAPALTGSTNTWIPTITGADALTGTANFTYDGNTLDVKNGGTASSINLYCESSNAHYIKLKSGPHASATSYTLTLPNAPPSVSGQALTATDAGVASWATVGGDNTPAFQAWRITSSQSIAHDTDTKLEFQGEVYDTDNAYDNSTNYRFTVPAGEGGKYMFYCGVHSDCENNGAYQTAIVRAKVNGSYMIIFNDTNYVAGYIRKATHAGSAVLDLAAADYVELYFQGTKSSSTGTNFTITANATYYQSFWGCYKMIGI